MLAAMTGYLFVVVIALAGLGVIIWAIVDAAQRPSSAWRAAGQSKALWISLIAVLTFVIGFGGFILAIVYLAAIRPKVAQYA